MSAAPIPQGDPAKIEVLASLCEVASKHLRTPSLKEAGATIRLQAAALAASEARVAELESLLNTPHTDDWFDGVRLEAGHQITRWGADHDAGKQPHDWFWLIGYLAGKALHAAMTGNSEKAKHHTISTGAALLNWFRAMTGDTNAMRPGIDTPKGEGETS